MPLATARLSLSCRFFGFLRDNDSLGEVVKEAVNF